MASKFIIDKKVPLEGSMPGPYNWRLVDAEGHILISQFGFATVEKAQTQIKAIKKAINKFTKTEIAHK